MKWTKKGHQFDALGKQFEKRNRIYIYGGGAAGAWSYSQLKFLDCVDGYIDRDEKKQQDGIGSVPVYNPEVILNGHDDSHLIIVAIKDRAAAANVELRLQLAGYRKNYDFFYYEDFIPPVHTTLGSSDNLNLRIYSVYAQNKVWLDSTALFPSTVCNLRCKHCLAFTPHIRQHRIKTLEECRYETDIFFQWVDYVRWFQISGGEPQLWPHLCELIEYIGETYRNKIGGRFEFVTNGTIIPSDRLVALMKRYGMIAVIDDYSANQIPNHAGEIAEKLKKNDIEYIYAKPEQWFDLGVFQCDNTRLNLVEYFNECAIPFHANEYGKIYLCAYADFAIKAGIMEETKEEYFDLNEEMTPDRKKEFTEFTLGYSTRGYSRLCERCQGWVETINKTVIPVAEQADE